MKKANSIIVAIIIATFVISMIAFQPTKIEAKNSAVLSATPTSKHKSKLKPKNFGADMMEGSNIRRKKPNRRKFDHIGNFKSTNAHHPTNKNFGADMLEGTNIRKKQPRNKRTQLRKNVGGYDTHTSQRKHKSH